MSLKQYAEKRDFRSTPEPKPGSQSTKSRQSDGWTFVVQKHDATRLHYDFRLELDGVLKSWAVPKGPSLNPDDRRLAVRTEDHPLEYGAFEGVIPKGEYGGGTVLLWDRGTWEPADDEPLNALERGKLSFTLQGERLRGSWALVRMRGGDDADAENWLLIKHDDAAARSNGDALIEDETVSVASGRSMDAIASDADAVWSEGEARNQRRTKKRRTKKRSKANSKKKTSTAKQEKPVGAIELEGAQPSKQPGAFTPELATLVDTAPAGERWLHELKFDGYRLLGVKTSRGVKLLTRNGKNWTDRFPPIAEAVGALPIEQGIVDGEAVVLDKRGQTDFQALQNAIKTQAFDRLVYYVFDVPHCNGYDLTRVPLVQRKQLLRRFVPTTDTGTIRYSDHVMGGGANVHREACELALEGIISKRADSPYVQQRTRDWVKVKCGRRQEFVIVGYTEPGGSRKGFGALLLGAHDDRDRLIYTGRVGTGFTDRLLKDLAKQLKARERKTSPLDERLDSSQRRGVHWVQPELVAEVEFTQWTDDGRLRHPSFKGLRGDKPADAIVIEQPEPVSAEATGNGRTRSAVKKKRTARVKAPQERNTIAGVTLTNADRVLYPEQGLTKRDLAEYMEAVSDVMLPFVVDRPLTVVRCPKGRQGQCFYQKHVRETLQKPIRAIEVTEESGEARQYIGIDNLPGLVALVQYGVLEMHTWGARADRLDRPDMITFDLDPGEGVSFEAIREAAVRVRELLQSVELESFVKTSGGKGLHVVAPIARRSSWDDVKAFAHAVAKRMARDDPGRYVATMSKAKRKGRIYVDYLRNSRGATSVAAYSPRARPNAPVSTPIRWDELRRLESAAQHTVRTLPRRLASMKTMPWDGFDAVRQQVTKVRMDAMLGG